MICLLLAALLCSCLSAAAEEAAPTVRVLLRRLNLTDRIDLQLTGAYTLHWGKDSRMLAPDRSRITVQVRRDRLFLFYAGAALDCGESLRFQRAEAGAATPGLTILPGDALYPGDLRLTVAGGQLQPVVTLNMEDYLLGVVPYEMSDDFPLEALKAQAVCARTYALSRIDPSKAWDLVDTTNDQVFRGVTGNHEQSARAVRETAGLVGTWRGKVAHCYYGASNGGQTELPAHVWNAKEESGCYAMTDDPYDTENPQSVVRRARIRKDGQNLPEEMVRTLREMIFAQPQMADWVHQEDAFRIDGVTGVTLTDPRYPEPSRLMTKLEISVSVSGKQLLAPETPDPLIYEPDDGEEDGAGPTPAPAAEPGLRLSEFRPAGTFAVSLNLFPYLIRELQISIYGADNEIVTVTEEGDHWLLSAGRYGHGVGMSQRGAQWMAEKYGKSFQEILNFYFPGMKLKKDDELVSVCVAYDDDELILISKDGYCNKYSSKILSDLAAKAQGVMGINVKNDELVCAVADHHDQKELLINTDKGGFKRIHTDKLELTSRNTKGYRIFRQIKSKPHSIVRGFMASSYNSLYVYNDGKLEEMSVSEVPFMELEQSFSMPLELNENYFYVCKDMSDIPDVEIIDIPQDYYSSQQESEQTTLFD